MPHYWQVSKLNFNSVNEQPIPHITWKDNRSVFIRYRCNTREDIKLILYDLSSTGQEIHYTLQYKWQTYVMEYKVIELART